MSSSFSWNRAKPRTAIAVATITSLAWTSVAPGVAWAQSARAADELRAAVSQHDAEMADKTVDDGASTRAAERADSSRDAVGSDALRAKDALDSKDAAVPKAAANIASSEPEGDSSTKALPTGADKSGVSSRAISAPQGSGKIDGMGESFSAQMSTGVATFNIPIRIPAARGQAQPALALDYSSSGGLGVAGMGWTIGVPFIARQSDHGPPKYDDRADFHPEQDRFVFNGGQELIPICTVGVAPSLTCNGALPAESMPRWAAGWQYFRARVEGSFQRFFWSADHLTWRVQDKSGVTLELGVPLDGSGSTNALERNPAAPTQVFSWHLARQYDTFGNANPVSGNPLPVNVIVYAYSNVGGRAYLTDIFDTTPAQTPTSYVLADFAHHTRLVYEDRPDPTTSYRSGWRIDQTRRLKRIDVTSKTYMQGTSAPRALVRRYHLGYDPGFHTSYLSSLQQEGRCASKEEDAPREGAGQAPDALGLADTTCGRLPPMSFSYSHSALGPTSAGYETFNTTVQPLSQAPGIIAKSFGVADTSVEFFDVNSDGLPDVVWSAPWQAFLNGPKGVAGSFGGATPMVIDAPAETPADAAAMKLLKLDNQNVAALDFDGDGVTDLVHTPAVNDVRVYSLAKNGAQLKWSARKVAGSQNVKVDFRSGTRATRVADVNFDGLVDVLVASGDKIQTFFSLGRYAGGQGRFGTAVRTGPETAVFSPDPVSACLPWAGQTVDFDGGLIQLGEMNGDGIVDIVKVSSGKIQFWPGRGTGYWGSASREQLNGGCQSGIQDTGFVAMGNSPFYSGFRPERVRLEDVNGDGLDDIVQVDEDSLSVWLNRDGSAWTDRMRLAQLPSAARDLGRVRFADVNGSGTTDIFWGNGGDYRYLDLAGGVRTGLLTKVDNGLGKTTAIEYTTSTAEMLLAEQNPGACDPNKPWTTPWCSKMPNVAHLVKRVTESNNLSVAGVVTSILTEYNYRDPVFDGRQREFRGFRVARARSIGDANAPTSSRESRFLLGDCVDETVGSFDDGIDNCADPGRDNPREALKGLPFLTTTYSDSGIYLSSDATAYRLRQLYAGRDGRSVRYAFPEKTRTTRYDSAAGAVSSKRLESFVDVSLERKYDATIDPLKVTSLLGDPTKIPSAEVSDTVQLSLPAYVNYAITETATYYDFFGNSFLRVSKGCVAGSECPTASPGSVVDESIYSYSLPGLPANQQTNWLYRTVASYTKGSTHSTVNRNSQKLAYTAEGALFTTSVVLTGSGKLDRFHAAGKAFAPQPAEATSDGTFVISTNTVDGFGNVTQEATPLNRCRQIAFDELKDAKGIKLGYALMPATETSYPGGCNTGSGLVRAATYDRGFGKLNSELDFAAQRTAYKFDEFGRLSQLRKPHADGTPAADADTPALQVTYTLPASPGVRYSIIKTQAQDGDSESNASYLETYKYVDGMGQDRVELHEADTSAGDGGKWVVSGLARVNAKGTRLLAFSEYFSNAVATSFPLSTTPGVKYRRRLYDAFDRVYRDYELDGTLVGEDRYHALAQDSWDAEDLVAASPHSGTFSSLRRDGHGRVIASVARNKVSGFVEASETRSVILPTGEPEIITRVQPAKVSVAPVVRWMRYDSLGHMVLNVDPNTTANFTSNVDTTDATMKAWHYVYNLLGELVGTSDARGCGTNYIYDGVGRIVGEDFSPCEAHHRDWVPPVLAPGATFGSGLDALYVYDGTANRPPGDLPPDFNDNPPKFLAGHLAAVFDRGQNAWMRYDGRGRVAAMYKRVVAPGANTQDFSATYAKDWFVRATNYDAADREIGVGTGAARLDGTLSSLLGANQASDVTTVYSARGAVQSVGSSYGPLITRVVHAADGLLSSVVRGDVAGTTTTYGYDVRRRVSTLETDRAAPSVWSTPGDYQPPPGQPGSPTTFQLVLQDDRYTYDLVGNPTKLEDLRSPEEWPTGALPVTRSAQYDALYRLTELDFSYGAADDAWTSPHAADIGGASDPRRATPGPHVQFVNRTRQQTFQYDWLGNIARSGDDQSGFYDRSLGDQTHDSNAPYRLNSASGEPGTSRSGSATLSFTPSGEVSSLIVKRTGPCLPVSSPCNQRFDYRWDEVGRLQYATRNDFASDGDQLGVPEMTLSFDYDSSDQRVVKAATSPTATRYTVYPFESFELRGAAFDPASMKYQRDETTEVPYLYAHGDRIARLAYYPISSDVPRRNGALLHVLYEIGDLLGSSSVVVDSDTSELVERRTYLAYGSIDSDYRPERWRGERADSGFGSKEEDIEIGLVYYGKRYASPYLARWLSPDPLGTHAPFESESQRGDEGSVHADDAAASPLGNVNPVLLNLYAFSKGSPLGWVDPNGLEPLKNQSGTAASFQKDFDTETVGKKFVGRGGGYAGAKASERLARYGKTNWLGTPQWTGWLNSSSSRYVYTKQGGWIDMTHFIFYAGLAYQTKLDMQKDYDQRGVNACVDPTPAVEHAVDIGRWQEYWDKPDSQYSYEDLPSDQLGAEFGAKVFDPKSKLTLGEQVTAYLNSLGATDPSNAPNWKDVPRNDNWAAPTGPADRNETTTPMFTTPEPKADGTK